MSHLIDRRENARGKSAVNRARFLRRYKAQIGAAVKKMVSERRLADMEQGGDVYVPRKDISEPAFGFGRGGNREIVLPGNRTFVAGDRIPRPDGAAVAAVHSRDTVIARMRSCSPYRAKNSCRCSSTIWSCRI